MNIHGNVHQILKQFAKQKQQILDELQEQREETEKQLHQFDALQKSISASPVPDIVRFNVGGQIFATNRNTLLSEQDTFFSAIIGTSLPLQTDEQDAIFIDRDPSYFAILLQYLRDKQWNWNNFTKPQQRQLQKEIEFYAIGSLLNQKTVPKKVTKGPFAWDRNATHPNLALSDDNRTAKGMAPGDVIADTGFTTGLHTWYITMHPNMDANTASQFHASQFYIGVGKLDEFKNDTLSAHYNMIYGISAQGGIYEQGNYKETEDMSWAVPNAIVKVVLDCDKRLLTVRDHIITLPKSNTPWYPMVIMGWYHVAECMTLSFE